MLLQRSVPLPTLFMRIRVGRAIAAARWRTALLAVVCGLLASGAASANLVNTIKGLKPGDEIGCHYTFKNGDPPIPCASDFVDANGEVSFLKPNAPFDAIEYTNITTGGKITALSTPLNVPVNDTLQDGMEIPILVDPLGSFFDVFVEISLVDFIADGLSSPGSFQLGQQLDFINGLNVNGFDGITIGNFTGSAFVLGFDVVSQVPEPGTLALVVLALGAGLRWRGLRQGSPA